MKTGIRDSLKNNKGFSIVEIIVVVAIISVLGASLFSMTGILPNARNKKVAKSVYTAIGRTKVNVMAKGNKDSSGNVDNYMKVWQDDEGIWVKIYYKNDNSSSLEKVGYANQVITYSDLSGAAVSGFPSSEATALQCTFDKSSGKVDEDGYTNFSKIVIGRYEVTLEPATGKANWGTF